MRRSFLLFSLMALASAIPGVSNAASLSPAISKDVQCFLLFSVGIDQSKDEEAKQVAATAVTYYLGRLNAAAPDLDIAQAVLDEATALEKNPLAGKIGAACDAEFAKRGEELTRIGKSLEKAAAQSSSSS